MKRGELAKLTGCNPETIRYYEQKGLMPEPERTESGYRQYGEDHVRRLRFIMRGRELDFTIELLHGLLSLVDRKAVSCAEVKEMAFLHLLAIREKIRDLERIERVLASTLESCSGEALPECPLIEALFEP